MREFHSTARAMATVCRWPPEREATWVRTDLSGPHGQAVEGLPGLGLHGVLVEQTGLGALAAEEHVVDDVEVVAQREVLVDDLDAEVVRVTGAVDGDGLALEGVVPRVEGVDAGDPLDQGALAGAVVADERGHAPGGDVEVDALEHVYGSEALVDAPQ